MSVLSLQRGTSRAHWLLATLAGLLLLSICAAQLWLYYTSAELNGRHHASGEVQLSNGQVLQLTHSLHIHNGRFYSMTRQGHGILETSGVVETGFLGTYRLRVERGEVHSLNEQSDDGMVFNLMYASHPDSVIHLSQLNGCLLARETQQLFCPES